MIKSSRTKGNESEDIASSYLKEKGWKILARNYKAIGGEIDIIAIYKNYLIAIEVKSGIKDVNFLSESVNKSKRIKIEKTLLHFKYRNSKLIDSINKMIIRFDVITVSMPEKKIVHFEQEFFDE